MASFVKTEWHQVASQFTYDIDDDIIEDTFGSVERFNEILSWQDKELGDNSDVLGDEPTEEEQDAFWELIGNSDYDREDDWWTDRKGGYEVTFKTLDEE